MSPAIVLQDKLDQPVAESAHTVVEEDRVGRVCHGRVRMGSSAAAILSPFQGSVIFSLSPRGLRPGLYSCAASRLRSFARLLRDARFALQFGGVFRDSSLLQQVIAWALLARYGARELGDKETGA
jgi:hypothetical protein